MDKNREYEEYSDEMDIMIHIDDWINEQNNQSMSIVWSNQFFSRMIN